MDFIWEIFLLIDGIFYWFIDIFYQIFMALASARILSDEVVTSLTQRIYIIVGVFMLFMIAYSLLTTLISPDNMSKGKAAPSKILKNFLITLIFLVFTPAMFNFMYTAQNVILADNVIGGLILGGDPSGENDIDGDYGAAISNGSAGKLMAHDVFSAFLFKKDPDATVEAKYEDTNGEKSTINFDDVRGKIMSTNDTNPFTIYLPFAGNISDGELTYIFIVSALFAIGVLYLFVTFSIDLAVRSLKLAYLQIIAPVPILFNVVPGSESVFNNWLKKVITVFLEVFVRLLIIYFVVFAVSLVPEFISQMFSDSTTGSGIIEVIAKAFIILGICIFGRMAPKLISETFGIKSDGLDLGIKKKFQEGTTVPGLAGLSSWAQDAAHIYNDTPKDQRQNAIQKLNAGRKALAGGAKAGFAGFVGSLGAKNWEDLKKSHTSSVDGAEAKRDYKKEKKRQRDEAIKKNREEIAAAEANNLDPTKTPMAVPKELTAAGAYMQQLGTGIKKWAGAEMDVKLKIDTLQGRNKILESVEKLTSAAMIKANNDDSIYSKYKNSSDIKQNGVKNYLAEIDELTGFDSLESAKQYVNGLSAESQTKSISADISAKAEQINKSTVELMELDSLVNASDYVKTHSESADKIKESIKNNDAKLTARKAQLKTGVDNKTMSAENIAALQKEIAGLEENAVQFTKDKDANDKKLEFYQAKQRVANNMTFAELDAQKLRHSELSHNNENLKSQIVKLEKDKIDAEKAIASKKQKYGQALFFIEKQMKQDITDMVITNEFAPEVNSKLYAKEANTGSKIYKELSLYDDKNSSSYPSEVIHIKNIPNNQSVTKTLDDGKTATNLEIQDLNNQHKALMELEEKRKKANKS